MGKSSETFVVAGGLVMKFLELLVLNRLWLALWLIVKVLWAGKYSGLPYKFKLLIDKINSSCTYVV